MGDKPLIARFLRAWVLLAEHTDLGFFGSMRAAWRLRNFPVDIENAG